MWEKVGWRHMGEMGGWAKLKKTRIKGEMWEKVGWRHLGEMGAVGGEIKDSKKRIKL